MFKYVFKYVFRYERKVLVGSDVAPHAGSCEAECSGLCDGCGMIYRRREQSFQDLPFQKIGGSSSLPNWLHCLAISAANLAAGLAIFANLAECCM